MEGCHATRGAAAPTVPLYFLFVFLTGKAFYNIRDAREGGGTQS